LAAWHQHWLRGNASSHSRLQASTGAGTMVSCTRSCSLLTCSDWGAPNCVIVSTRLPPLHVVRDNDDSMRQTSITVLCSTQPRWSAKGTSHHLVRRLGACRDVSRSTRSCHRRAGRLHVLWWRKVNHRHCQPSTKTLSSKYEGDEKPCDENTVTYFIAN
jgi:hypothetical protein